MEVLIITTLQPPKLLRSMSIQVPPLVEMDGKFCFRSRVYGCALTRLGVSAFLDHDTHCIFFWYALEEHWSWELSLQLG